VVELRNFLWRYTIYKYK